MTSQHHLHLIVTQNCQNLIYPCWCNRERVLSHVHRHHWKVIKHFFMSNMDVMSKQLWSTASTMRSQHHLHLHSTVTQNCQQNADLGLLLYKSKGGCVCPQTSLKSAKTLHMCPVWMWEAVKGGLQPQQWHNKVIYTGQRPGIEKIWPIRIGETNNLVRMHFYVHRQHLEVLKHFTCIQYGCEKQSKVVYSLNHDITASFTLDSDPELPKADLSSLV
jgi:hypothetical protein